MEVKILDKDHAEVWDQFVMENPHAIAWHLWEWSRLVEKHHGCRFFPLAVLNGAEILGILPLYHARTFTGKNRLISVAHAVAGGILADDQEVRDRLLNRAVSLCEELGCSGLTLKQYKIPMPGKFRTDDNYYNRELSLEGGEEALLGRISEINRQIIEKVSGEDLTLEYPSSDHSGFYRFMLRHHRRKGVPCAGKGWIRDLETLGMYRIAVLKRNGRPLAATMVKEFRDTISFPFTSASGNAEQDQLPVYRLYWELMKEYSKRGFRICHSGRIPLTDDVDAFRLGWGGTRYPYHYQYYPDTGGVTEFSQKRNWKRKLVGTFWKRIPLSLAGKVGPFIVRQFP